MRRKLISHEVPLSLMGSGHQRAISDYMYVLLHKAIADPAYEKAVLDYKAAGGIVYLDNSCFELGAALDDDLLYEYCEKLKPDVVILPDVLGDKNATIDRTFKFLDKYPHVANYGMAVAQGETPEELIECYAEFRDYRNIDEYDIYMLGIPFVFKWVPKEERIQAGARMILLDYMNETRIIDKHRPHHLLGTWWAGEFAEYRGYGWVHSLDTSNPVMAAIDNMKYEPDRGVDTKPKSTFDSTYNLEASDIDMDLLYFNVNAFRSIVNGD